MEKNERADSTKVFKQYQSFLEAAITKYSIPWSEWVS